MVQKTIAAQSLGEAWIRIMKSILCSGKTCDYSDNAGIEFPVKELLGIVVTIHAPSWPDSIIEQYAIPEEFEWMRENFEEVKPVKELFHEDSYGTRLYCYMGLKDQVAEVIQKLKGEPRLRSATVTTFQPLKDDKYIPCVSMVDFNIEDGCLCLYTYCRALDFGTKAYANLAMLYQLQKKVAEAVGVPTGDMTLFVKSAHLYEKNIVRATEIVSAFPQI